MSCKQICAAMSNICFGATRDCVMQIWLRVRLPLALLHVLLLVECELRYAHLAHARARGGVLLLVSLLLGLVLFSEASLRVAEQLTPWIFKRGATGVGT